MTRISWNGFSEVFEGGGGGGGEERERQTEGGSLIPVWSLALVASCTGTIANTHATAVFSPPTQITELIQSKVVSLDSKQTHVYKHKTDKIKEKQVGLKFPYIYMYTHMCAPSRPSK